MADELNFQIPKQGFDSYLYGIIPDDQAVLAGAFSVSMQQVRNIDKVTVPQFAKVAYSMESTVGLPLTNGTDIPTDTPLLTEAKVKTSLGSGVYGSYTTSNFFGAMSGLPYPWQALYEAITNIQTQKLINIYQELFLAVTWQQATIKLVQPYWYEIAIPYVPPTVSPNPPNPAHLLPEQIPNPAYNPALPPGPGNEPTIPNPDYSPIPYVNGSTGAETECPTYYSDAGQRQYYDWYYSLAITQYDGSGGYGRGTAPKPSVTISPNNVLASVQTIMGTNPNDCSSVNRKSYGRITTVINNGGRYKWLALDPQTNWVDKSGQDTCGNPPTPPIIPPRDFAWVQANIPKETITIEHPPIASLPVQVNGSKSTNGVNTPGDVWADPTLFPGPYVISGYPAGLQTLGTAFWPNPGNAVVQGYIDQANEEIQSIRTRTAQGFQQSSVLNTLWNITGIALKHEQRARYIAMAPVPVPWDVRTASYPTALYNLVDSIPEFATQTEPHMATQTLEHISNILTTGGQSTIAMMRQERNQDRLAEVGIELDNNMSDRLDIDLEKRLMSNGTLPGAVEGIESPDGNIYTIPAWPENTNPIAYWDCDENALRIVTGLKGGSVLPILEGAGCPIVNPEVPAGEGPLSPESSIDPAVDPVNIFVVEQPLPPEINTDFTGTTLKPSTYDVNDAIDKVIECNCTCWVN